MPNRWLAVLPILWAALPALALAQPELVQPRCAPAWWDAEALVAALEVELADAETTRIVFVVDEPCADQTIVSVLVEAPDGRRRRSIDVGDLPESARPRAIGMGVAALMRGPPEAEESVEAREPSDRTETEVTIEVEAGVDDEPSEPDAPWVSAESPRSETGSATETARANEQPDPVPDDWRAPASADPDAAPNPEPSDAPTPPWALRATAVGLWTTPGAPWAGAGGALERRVGPLWLSLGVDGARAHATDPLGGVRGRWVSTSLAVSWARRWLHVSLGARAALALDWVRFIGTSDRDDVATQAKHLWSGAAELAGTLGVIVSPRVELLLDVGVHLTPWGLSARSPSGSVLAMQNASGLARVGLRVSLGR